MSFDFSQFHTKADKAIDHVSTDIGTLRTGKASVQLLDAVQVEAYGTYMKVNELANVSAPDPNLLVVAPWDKSLLGPIEKGIAGAGINLNPVVDGDLIRIMVPSLTEERRKEMVKLLYQKIESGRVLLRSIRTDIKKEIEDQKSQGGVSEDDISHQLEQLEKLTKDYMDKLEKIAEKKEQELMTV